jgi:threonine dehydrogenase-like Zn-dependent dehydrogenase
MLAALFKGPHSIEVGERPDPGMVGVDASIATTIVFRNVGLRGGVAPVRTYIPELLNDVLAGRIDPGLVFDHETDLDHIVEAYMDMDERRAIKSLVRVAA